MHQNCKQKPFVTLRNKKKQPSITFSFAHPSQEQFQISPESQIKAINQPLMHKKKSSMKAILKNLDFFFEKTKSKLNPYDISNRFYQKNYQERQIPIVKSYELMQSAYKNSYKKQHSSQQKLRIKLEILKKVTQRTSCDNKINDIKTPIKDKQVQYQPNLTEGHQIADKDCCNRIKNYLHNKFKISSKAYELNTIHLTASHRRTKSKGLTVISSSLSSEKTNLNSNYSPLKQQNKRQDRRKLHTITLKGKNSQSTKKIKIKAKKGNEHY